MINQNQSEVNSNNMDGNVENIIDSNVETFIEETTNNILECTNHLNIKSSSK